MELINAINKGEDYDTLKTLIENGADVNFKGEYDKSPLHYALDKKCDISIIKLLLDNGAYVNAKNDAGVIILHYATFYRQKSYDIVKLLLDKGADVYTVNSDGYNVLHYAIWQNNTIDTIRLILDRCTKLMSVTEYVNLRETYDLGNVLHMLHLSDCDAEEKVKLFIENGINIHCKSKFNYRTPLHRFIELYSGVSEPYRTTCLNIIKIMLEHTKDVTTRIDNFVFDGLWFSARYNMSDMVKLLLENGSDPLTRYEENKTLLHLVIRNIEYNIIEITRLLLEKNIDVNAQDYNGNTALHDVMTELKRRDCYVTKKPITKCELGFIVLLLMHGADINIKNNKGETVVDIWSKSVHAGFDLIDVRDQIILRDYIIV